MNRQLRRPAALAPIVLVTLISGCGSSAPADNGNNAATNHDKAVKFAVCMRVNGVSNFPDPNTSGSFTIEAVANGSSVNTAAPAFKQAINTCKKLEPAGFMGTKRTPQQQEAGLKFAQCIRQNGVPDFPDPTPDSPLVDTNRIPSASTPGGMSVLRAAMQRCGHMAVAAGVHR
jgi:hypothetical protein